MGKIIAVTNQKGGVGKTTTCINLAAAVKNRGKRVLVIDMDPQGNCTSGLGLDKNTEPNIYDVLVGAGTGQGRGDPGEILPRDPRQQRSLRGQRGAGWKRRVGNTYCERPWSPSKSSTTICSLTARPLWSS